VSLSGTKLVFMSYAFRARMGAFSTLPAAGEAQSLVGRRRGCQCSLLRWYRKFGQWLKLGLLLRRTELDDEQTEAVFGGFQGEGSA
jgi:hypothetical protein